MGLVFLMLIIAGFAALVKGSARILGDMVITWKNCLFFAQLYISIVTVSRMII